MELAALARVETLNHSNCQGPVMAEAARNAAGNGGNLTSKEMDRELDRLKSDMAQISQHVSKLLNATGSHAARKARNQMNRARKSVDGVLSEATDMGTEAADAMREVRDTLADAVEESVQNRPFTTLAMAVAAGFVIGAIWRR
jgi:ElaB/YqjD/DUF883 family membrane-anchored ribosome-binding protein